MQQKQTNSTEKSKSDNVFKILKTNISKKGIEYLVQYKPNYSQLHYKWVTKADIENKALINEYYIEQEIKKKDTDSKCPYKILGVKKVTENDQTRINLMVIKKDAKDNSEPEELPSALFKTEYPEELIKFYESHTTV